MGRPMSEYPVYAVLPCSDYARAREWYEQKLGLVPTEEMPGNGWYHGAAGTWFILTTSQYAGTAQNTAAGFTVTGIESVMDDLRERGVTFLEYDFGDMGKTSNGLMVMGGYKAAWFRDSEGNVLEISQVPET
jgi:catechol 2,3-dioxygenase-like lactoylglutathione lyase family enzyme